ncbi:hypothetical protein J132_04229 [Termitomyces sp. J132]|nr:hypothetical protein J132_04229 [Termitomyces sp. J132]
MRALQANKYWLVDCRKPVVETEAKYWKGMQSKFGVGPDAIIMRLALKKFADYKQKKGVLSQQQPSRMDAVAVVSLYQLLSSTEDICQNTVVNRAPTVTCTPSSPYFIVTGVHPTLVGKDKLQWALKFAEEHKHSIKDFNSKSLDVILLKKMVTESSFSAKMLPDFIAGAISSVVDLVLCYQSHVEHAVFAITSLGKQDMILSLTWLWKHNSKVDWAKSEVTMSWCPQRCSACTTEAKEEC